MFVYKGLEGLKIVKFGQVVPKIHGSFRNYQIYSKHHLGRWEINYERLLDWSTFNTIQLIFNTINFFLFLWTTTVKMWSNRLCYIQLASVNQLRPFLEPIEIKITPTKQPYRIGLVWTWFVLNRTFFL